MMYVLYNIFILYYNIIYGRKIRDKWIRIIIEIREPRRARTKVIVSGAIYGKLMKSPD